MCISHPGEETCAQPACDPSEIRGGPQLFKISIPLWNSQSSLVFIEAASYPSSNSVLLLHATFPGVSSKGTKPLLSRGKGFCYRPASLVLSLACPSHSTGINPKSFCLFFHLLCSEKKGYSAWLATQLSNSSKPVPYLLTRSPRKSYQVSPVMTPVPCVLSEQWTHLKKNSLFTSVAAGLAWTQQHLLKSQVITSQKGHTKISAQKIPN